MSGGGATRSLPNDEGAEELRGDLQNVLDGYSNLCLFAIFHAVIL